MSGWKAGTFFSVALALAIAGCGDDRDGVTTPVTSPPNVSGAYTGYWTLQVLRKSDGFKKQFYCQAWLTVQQAETDTKTARLSGWIRADFPCSPESYELEGTVGANGAIAFTTDGPAPPEGPCPGSAGVRFSGQRTLMDSGGSNGLSARGVTDVTCPEYGAHQFTYIIEARRY